MTTYLSGHFGESSVSMEALQEFKIQTSGLSAEYGRHGRSSAASIRTASASRPLRRRWSAQYSSIPETFSL